MRGPRLRSMKIIQDVRVHAEEHGMPEVSAGTREKPEEAGREALQKSV